MLIKYEAININAHYDLKTINRPISVYFKVTTKCMLNCSFCSQSDEKKMDMDFDFAKEQLRNFHNMGIDYVFYTGGEPLLYPYIVELLKYGDSIGLKQILITNGVLLFKDELKECLNYIVSIGISLHGNENIHNKLSGNDGCWKYVTRNIELMRSLYPKLGITINCTVVKENSSIENFKFLLGIAEKFDAKLSFARLNYIANGKKYDCRTEINGFLKNVSDLDSTRVEISNCIVPCVVDPKYQYLSHGCGAGISIASIEPNGDVKICPSSQIAVGNLYKHNFKKIWKNKYLSNFRTLNWLPLICKLCKNLPKCKGGCHCEHSEMFWKESCDELLLFKIQNVWKEISNRKLTLKYKQIRKENSHDYLLLSFPARKINKTTYNILKLINGKYTGVELCNMFEERDIIKNFLATLRIDGVIEVEYDT